MSGIVNIAIKNYNHLISVADPRTKNWFLIWESPLPVFALCAFYILFVSIGKKIMKNREEIYVPPAILFIYNIGLVILSIYIGYELIVGAYLSNYNLICVPLRVTNDKNEMRVTVALWLYFISKAIEFFDTFFMIIRKKFNQVTFLHVFHHSSILILWWIGVMYMPGGQAFFGPILNSIVHAIMYTYYGLSAIPSLRDKLWWKKYITKIQFTQFIFAFIHTIQSIVFDCDFPRWPQFLLASYIILMVILFSNYYRHEYVIKSNEKKRAKQSLKKSE